MSVDEQKAYWEDYKSRRRAPEHPVVRELFEPRADYVASLVADSSLGSVLDVGCGNGFLQYYLEKRFKRCAGLDYSEDMLEINPCREKVQGSVTDLPFEDDTFDVVVESHLLHHVPNDELDRAVSEMARVAKVAMVFYEPNRNNPLMFLFALLKKEERLAMKFSSRFMENLVSKSSPLAENSVEGVIVPNKAPPAMVGILRKFRGTFVERNFGFYLRTTATTG
jgi:SAM-dependent methyltransferase